MSNIVRVVDFEADFESEFPISARELWRGLEISRKFTDWVTDQIQRADLQENQDFEVFHEKVKNSEGGRPSNEYYLTINAAEHITLMSQSPKGKIYRQALIDIKKKFLTQGPIPAVTLPEERATLVLGAALKACALLDVPKHFAQIESCKFTKSRTGVDFSPFLQLAPAQDNVPDSAMVLEPVECAKRFGFKSATQFNRHLRDLNLQKKSESGWEPIGHGAGNAFRHAWKKGDKSGYNLKWNVSFLENVLTDRRIKSQAMEF